MKFKYDVNKLIQRSLEDKVDYILLRGADEHSRDGGDIDVLVPKGYGKKALKLFADSAVDNGIFVVTVLDIGYISQICIAKIDSENKNYLSLKIDFFDGLGWLSIGTDRIGNAVFKLNNKNPQHARAIVTYFQKLLYTGKLRHRDFNRVSSIFSNDILINFFADYKISEELMVSLPESKLSMINLWRLRLLSIGITIQNSPLLIIKTLLWKLKYSIIKSSLSGVVFCINSDDESRNVKLVNTYLSLLKSAELPESLIISSFCRKKTKLNIIEIIMATLLGKSIFTFESKDQYTKKMFSSFTLSCAVDLKFNSTSSIDDVATLLTQTTSSANYIVDHDL